MRYSCFRLVRIQVTTLFLLKTLFYSGIILLMLSQYKMDFGGDRRSRITCEKNVCSRDSLNKDRRDDVVFIIILCEDNAQSIRASSVTRQIRQGATMLKSAASLTSTTVRFLVVADSEKLYYNFTNTTSDWPDEYKMRINFEWHPVWYPNDRENMRTMFRPCATERLFLPEIFPNLDAGIYIDTDLIFMRPPEDLWAEFHKFDEIQVAAMAPCLNHYGSKENHVPFFGDTGLNAGVMHMNFTRMKNFPEGGWIAANMKVFDTFQKKIKLADQDILNILFYKYPEYLYELGCEWNYRIFQCSAGNKCPAAAKSGISILHGNAMSFVSGKEMKLQAVFEAWEQHQLGKSLSLLLKQLEIKLKHFNGLRSKCANTPNIDDILTKELKKHVL